MIIISVYRPYAAEINIFLREIEELLVNIFSENKLMFMAGDYNIEMIKPNKARSDLFSLMNSFNLFATIEENTHITNNKAGCIVNIFTNSVFLEAYTFEHHISDHLAQKIVFIIEPERKKLNYKRIFSDENNNTFLACLRNQDWLEIYDVERSNVNKQWDVFMNCFMLSFNGKFPLKLMRKKIVVPENPVLIACKNRLNIFLSLSSHNGRLKKQYNNEKKYMITMIRF